MSEPQKGVPDENDRASGKGPPLPADPAGDIPGLGARWSKAAAAAWIVGNPTATAQHASRMTGIPLTTVRTWMDRLRPVADAAGPVRYGADARKAAAGTPADPDGGGGGPEQPPPPDDHDAPDGARPPRPDRRKVNVGDRRDQLHTIRDVWREVGRANTPPRLFGRSGEIVRVSADDSDARFEVLDRQRTMGHLRRLIRPIIYKKPKTAEEIAFVSDKKFKLIEVDVPMPTWIADDIVAAQESPFPPVESIVTAPVLVPGGRLVVLPGYDAPGRLWYGPPPGFRLGPVPTKPTDAEVADALTLIRGTWLGEVQFEGDRDRAHAMALLFGPFVRPMIQGPTPLHLVEASKPGTGKSLLPELLGTVFLGKPPGGSPMPSREEEINKQIGTDLREGHPIIFFDNVKGKVRSASLEAALTLGFYRGRILGVSENIHARICNTWVMSANNAVLGEEMNRRTVRIRIDADQTRAQKKVGYTIRRIREWTVEHRPELLLAVLTLLTSWTAAGMPDVDIDERESFEAWSRLMASLLGHLGIEGLLAETDDAEDGFEEGEAEALCVAWFDRYGLDEIRSSDLVPVLMTGAHLEQTIGERQTERGYSTALGMWLDTVRDREFGAFRVVRSGQRSGHRRYRLARATGSDS